MRRFTTCVMLFLGLGIGSAQTSLFLPAEFKRAYMNHSRSMTGAPGKNYWQNKPSYKMRVELDPATYTIRGELDVRYENRSPDTLQEIVWSMLGDIYARNSLRDLPEDVEKLGEGMKWLALSVSGQTVDLNKDIVRRGTNGILKLTAPLLPGHSIEMSARWTFTYPKDVTIRNGHYGDSTFLIGHCFPKIAVYDDIDGWDKTDYRGYAEFYGEQGDYDVSVVVPGDFKVWATGELQNAQEVLAQPYLQRWQKAQSSKEVVHIVSKEEAESRVTVPGEKITWHFKAENVPDFAFGSSHRFCWDARKVVVDSSNGGETLVQTAYPPERVYYPRLIYMMDTLMHHYSRQIPGIPYPYPVMTIFNGNDGMEYPMMCNNGEGKTWSSSVGLAYHEVAHTYFPFFVGTNERKYAWMDEGWASFFPQFYWGLHIPEFNYFQSRMDRYYKIAGTYDEVPLMASTRLLHDRPPYRQASYNKPFFAYSYLQHLLGQELFVKALRTYMRRWAGKHPTPYDFFNTFNEVAKMDLNWYWEAWFFRTGYADMALELGANNTLVVVNKGGLPLPIKVEVLFKDGTKKIITLSLDTWQDGGNAFELPMPNKKGIKSITLGDDWILDVNPENNVLKY